MTRSNEHPSGNPFGEVIYAYTRKQAIEDGVLIDVTDMAREAGFRWPVAVTAAVWADCVAWSDEDNAHQPYQDESGRLWDLLFVATYAVQTARQDNGQLKYDIWRVPRDGHSTDSQLVSLKLIAGPGDAGEPVVTIMQPHED
jgi:hypothetical protein